MCINEKKTEKDVTGLLKEITPVLSPGHSRTQNIF